eukprot:2613681-Karenia_brevis.AAC.1
MVTLSRKGDTRAATLARPHSKFAIVVCALVHNGPELPLQGWLGEEHPEFLQCTVYIGAHTSVQSELLLCDKQDRGSHLHASMSCIAHVRIREQQRNAHKCSPAEDNCRSHTAARRVSRTVTFGSSRRKKIQR